VKYIQIATRFSCDNFRLHVGFQLHNVSVQQYCM